jgi:hypothetical protein
MPRDQSSLLCSALSQINIDVQQWLTTVITKTEVVLVKCAEPEPYTL